MYNKKNNGSVLVYALGVISFVSILLLGLVQLITSQAKVGYDAIAREKAFQIVEACSNDYRWYLAHNTDGHTIEEVTDFWSDEDPKPWGLDSPKVMDIKDSNENVIGRCNASITNTSVNSNTPVNVEFTAYAIERPSIKKTLQVRFKRTSWSDYVVLSNEYANFDSNWDISGRIMSNTGVRFDGVSHGKVYAGSTTYFDPVTGASKPGVWSSQPLTGPGNCAFNAGKTSCVFLGGKRYPVPQKDFAGIAVDLNAMKNTAQAPGGATVDNCRIGGNNCYFNVPAGKAGKHITLKANGTFDIITVKDVKNNSNDIKNEDGSSAQNLPIPQNGIIFVGGSIWVEGVVDGKRVTIVAGEGVGDIYIGNGNLRYTNKNGSDAIGLIAKGNILLTNEKKNCVGDECKNLEIDAAMVAKDGKVGKQDFNPNCCGVGCEVQKNRLDLYGSVVSNKFIEFTASKFCNGNSDTKIGFQVKNITYDNYLYMDPPPFFPTDVFYTVDLWNEI